MFEVVLGRPLVPKYAAWQLIGVVSVSRAQLLTSPSGQCSNAILIVEVPVKSSNACSPKTCPLHTSLLCSSFSTATYKPLYTLFVCLSILCLP